MIQLWPYMTRILSFCVSKIEYRENIYNFSKSKTEEKWVGYIEEDKWSIKLVNVYKVIGKQENVVRSHKYSGIPSFDIEKAIQYTLHILPGIMFRSKKAKRILYGAIDKNIDGSPTIKLHIEKSFNSNGDALILNIKEAADFFYNITDWKIKERNFEKKVPFQDAVRILSTYNKIGIAIKSDSGIIMESEDQITSQFHHCESWIPVDRYFLKKNSELLKLMS